MEYLVKKTTFWSIILLSLLCISEVSAQDKNDYFAEIGIQGGGSLYAGEVNSIGTKFLFLENAKTVQPSVGAFLRYKFNHRFALRLGYDNTSVKGNFAYVDNSTKKYIDLNNTGIGLIDLWGEYNFFDLQNNEYKRYSKKYSPYIFCGAGYAFMPSSNAQSKSAVTMPFGLGVKFILNPRWNLNFQWTNHLLLSDNLEGLSQFDDPFPHTKLNPLNNDLLWGLSFGISFNFWEKGCDCYNNSRAVKTTNTIKKPLNYKKGRSR